MVDRIKKIMEYYELSPASFAEQIGINRSNLTHLFSGRNQPSLELAKKILHYFPNVKTEWLIMGVGEMFLNNEEKELAKKVMNEKKRQNDNNAPNLFTVAPFQTISVPISNPEKAVQSKDEPHLTISDSKYDIEKPEPEPIFVQPVLEKKPAPLPHVPNEISKIVLFYSDGTFEMFRGRT
jgi:DNA-binding XRE family transcriptional regulator